MSHAGAQRPVPSPARHVTEGPFGFTTDEELRSHIEMRAADNLAAGMSPKPRASKRKNASANRPPQGRTRNTDIIGWLDVARARFSLCAPHAAAQPGFTAVAVLTLASASARTPQSLGHNSVLLRPLPYHDQAAW